MYLPEMQTDDAEFNAAASSAEAMTISQGTRGGVDNILHLEFSLL